MSSLIDNDRSLKQDVSISNNGDNTVITINSGEMPATWENKSVQIAIDHINLQATGTVTIQLQSGKSNDTEGTHHVYGGLYSCVAGTAIVLENSVRHPMGVITLAPNQSLIITLGGGVQVSGFIRYRLLNVN